MEKRDSTKRLIWDILALLELLVIKKFYTSPFKGCDRKIFIFSEQLIILDNNLR